MTTSFFNANNVYRTILFSFFQGFAVFFPTFAKLKCSDRSNHGMKLRQTFVIHEPVIRGYITTEITPDTLRLFVDYAEHDKYLSI